MTSTPSLDSLRDAVVEAARRYWMQSGTTRETINNLHALRDAVRALDAATAPKKPMTAEQRATKLHDDMMGARSIKANVDLIASEIREAESAAWDRAIVQAHDVLALLISKPDLYPTEWTIKKAVLDLKGRCHDA